MTIGIVGNYGNDNQGDDAILEGILVQLDETYKINREEIIVFSNKPDQIEQKHGVQSFPLFQKRKSDPMKLIATVIKNKPIIKKLDLLIIGGGGILMDLYKNGPIIIGMYGWLARLTKTPVVIYGAGAGPISSFAGKQILKSLGNMAKLVTVRDPKSKDLLQSIGVKEPIYVISDPAFYVKPPNETEEKKEGFQIGVTAVPFYNKSYWPVEDRKKYTDYINGMAHNLDSLLHANPSAGVNFFSTKHPFDTEVTKDIKELMVYKDRCTLVDQGINYREILNLVNKQDLVIGTRLHSLILSLVAHTPIIAVAYHHKVQDFMDMIDCSEFVLPIDRLNQRDDLFLNLYHKLDKDWNVALQRFTAIADRMRGKQSNGAELLKRIYKRRDKKAV
ncbi:Polysaccharide pyruvyl transferase family protein WcaK [Lentibacillus persicus]|uniref:Polysaccharide pyruvyl transferase family protein WcaK n=1 Tax=Lentibacillus persicus TaxID=640948 RepID=A0A1I1VU38_9BACI|nr:polysaccharide pyruvyl transferase family protein [Lentibacillus persicus]SFD86249.1 Polysaccharide pyruvyl transferase family protein WcaK [Lentibacillus persicus]